MSYDVHKKLKSSISLDTLKITDPILWEFLREYHVIEVSSTIDFSVKNTANFQSAISEVNLNLKTIRNGKQGENTPQK